VLDIRFEIDRKRSGEYLTHHAKAAEHEEACYRQLKAQQELSELNSLSLR